MRKEMISDMMNGYIDLEKITEPLDMVVQNEFSDGGECEKIFRKVYNRKKQVKNGVNIPDQ